MTRIMMTILVIVYHSHKTAAVPLFMLQYQLQYQKLQPRNKLKGENGSEILKDENKNIQQLMRQTSEQLSGKGKMGNQRDSWYQVPVVRLADSN
jgi:hypothetical protein